MSQQERESREYIAYAIHQAHWLRRHGEASRSALELMLELVLKLQKAQGVSEDLLPGTLQRYLESHPSYGVYNLI
jgi:hypothetical protein